MRGARSIIRLQPTTVRQTYFYPGANKANHITGYETEVVNLTGHRFGGIFAPFPIPESVSLPASARVWWSRSEV